MTSKTPFLQTPPSLKGVNVYEEDVTLRHALQRIVPQKEFALIEDDLRRFGWRVTGGDGGVSGAYGE